MFCFACGESIPAEKARQTSEAADDDALFHCPNLQGVILGVGLSMLEQVYADQSQDATPEHVHKSRQSKKRKVEGSSKSSSIVSGGDEVDDVYYASVGKKTKGGVGYAGEQREDVRIEIPVFCSSLTFFPRILDSLKLRQFNLPKTRK